MKPANDNRQARDGLDERLLDRMVDGELADDERWKVLLQLEKEPNGWRRCALAFLESQTWRQALATATSPRWVARPESAKGVSSASTTPFASCSGRATRSRLWRPVARLTGLAAGLAVAFALGWAYHRAPEQSASSTDVNRQAGLAADRAIQATPEPAVRVATAPSMPKPTQPAAAIDPIVKNLQQRGYSVETQQRLVSMESKDGRKVKLPVQEVRIRYTGDRIY